MKKIRIGITAILSSLFLLTGCDQPSIKLNFNIDPNSPTLKEEVMKLYDDLVALCKAETKTWRVTNEFLFEGFTEFEDQGRQYDHFMLLYNEYTTYMSSDTRNFITQYKNDNYYFTYEMNDRLSHLAYWCKDSKARFPASVDQANQIENDLLRMKNEASYTEQHGFVCYYNEFYKNSQVLRNSYNSPKPNNLDKWSLDNFSLALPWGIEMDMQLLIDLTQDDVNAINAFLSRYNNQVNYFMNYFIDRTYEYNGFTR